MSEPFAYLNGQFMPQSQAALPLHDAGFVMGATVTDLCRTVKHQLYRWPEHLARFRRSCSATYLDLPGDDDEITAIAEELVARNTPLLPANSDLALVIFATPGLVGYYLGDPGGAGDGPVTFGLHTFPLPFARYRRWVEHGATLSTPTIRALSGDCVHPNIKQRSRMHWWLADQEVKRTRPGAVALLLDTSGHVTETAAANVLIVRDGVVLSPPSEAILEGVSLTVVRELCKLLKVPFEHRPLTVDDFKSADEAWLTSTPFGSVGVRQVKDFAVPFPGPLMQRVQTAWTVAIDLDLHAQILA
jgi:branched-chain amino acid aminotransferase